jgi:pimeloyl-ACP methyl ester carboxylesterase
VSTAFIAGVSATSLILASFIGGPAARAADTGMQRYTDQVLDWRTCSYGECATMQVPMNYGDPTAGEISIAVSRTVTKGARERLGSLVVNPGGPGEPGRAYARDLARSSSPALRSAYDIVGFDPRGVRQSSPVECLNGKNTTRLLMADPSPDDKREEDALWKVSALPSAGCENVPLARHVSTTNAARDLDVLRAVLGDAQLNWLGLSYGTELGTRYAELFPQRVGRMVLDGAVDPSLDAMQISRAQSVAFQRALNRFAGDCITHPKCVARSSAGVIAVMNSLLQKADRAPLGKGSRTVNEAQVQAALFLSMYSPTFWPILRTGLAQAVRGNATTLRLLSDAAWDRSGPDRYRSNSTSAFLAISCWDSPATPGKAGLRRAATAWSTAARVPSMARAMAWGNAPCSQWFGHDANPPAPANTTTQASILVIGTTEDPATPYAWAIALNRQLPTSRLLTYVGDGHTAYGNGVRCIDQAVNAFLIAGTLPAAGTRCT